MFEAIYVVGPAGAGKFDLAELLVELAEAKESRPAYVAVESDTGMEVIEGDEATVEDVDALPIVLTETEPVDLDPHTTMVIHVGGGR